MAESAEIELLIRKLGDARARLWAAITALEPADLIYRRGSEWSVKDIVAHVAAAEEINVRFGKLMVREQEPVQLTAFAGEFPDYSGPFTLDGFNAYMMGKLGGRPLEQVLAVLDETRSITLAWVETLTPDLLERSGLHAVWGGQTVRDMLRILALHDRLHAGDILKRKSRIAD